VKSPRRSFVFMQAGERVVLHPTMEGGSFYGVGSNVA
jgi:hypothetical protein